MRSRLIHDLTSWEQGKLSLETLSARHQGADSAGAIALHHTLAQMTAHKVAPPTAQQVERLLARLPERAVRGGVLSALQTSASRRLVALLTSVLMSGGVAYAAGYTPVKERVDSMLHGITSLFDGSKGNGDRKRSNDDPSDERGVGGSPRTETPPGSTGTGRYAGSSGTNPSGDDRPSGEDGETDDNASPDDHEGDGGTDDDNGDDDGEPGHGGDGDEDGDESGHGGDGDEDGDESGHGGEGDGDGDESGHGGDGDEDGDESGHGGDGDGEPDDVDNGGDANDDDADDADEDADLPDLRTSEWSETP